MKRIAVLALGVAFMISFGSYGFAAEKKKTTVKTTVTTAKISEAQTAAIANAAVEKLNSQAWTIYIIPSGSGRSAVETDVLTFSERTMSSRNLGGKGYSSSNFLPIVREDGSVMLEAVQRSGEDKLAMWRVELSGDILQGVLTLRTVNGPVSTYTFTTNVPASGQASVSTTKKK